MSPIRSLGNRIASFRNKFGNTGLNAVNPAPLVTKATGGDITFIEGGYTYHVYTTTGASTFVVDKGPITAQYLVVGGGGATGQTGGGGGGGGGAGGLLNSTVPLANNPYPVVVGAGGAYTSATNITSGLDSKFNTAVAAGGGRGGHYNPSSGYVGADAGGSGGGAEAKDRDTGNGAGNVYAPNSPLHPAPAPGQGNAGGSSPSPNNPGNDTGGGGGGGAGGAGGDVSAPTPKAGDGGNGLAVPWVPSSYGTPGPDGSLRYFAGGGGGGGQNLAGGSGGYGGGGDGNGSGSGSGSPGTANTGGGAGAPSSGNGANGGSGIVIVRYT